MPTYSQSATEQFLAAKASGDLSRLTPYLDSKAFKAAAEAVIARELGSVPRMVDKLHAGDPPWQVLLGIVDARRLDLVPLSQLYLVPLEVWRHHVPHIKQGGFAGDHPLATEALRDRKLVPVVRDFLKALPVGAPNVRPPGFNGTPQQDDHAGSHVWATRSEARQRLLPEPLTAPIRLPSSASPTPEL
jgi:hypothetical protein